MSATVSDYISFLGNLVSGEKNSFEEGISAGRDSFIKSELDHSQRLRVLDLANGRLRPQSELLSTKGHDVIGIDLANYPRGSLVEIAYRFARWLFRLRLRPDKEICGSTSYLCANVENIPIKSESFDLVTSIAAFEHFLNVPKVVRELYRVLRPGGIIYCGIHHFSSLSGGHNVQLVGLPIKGLPKGIQPWDHLRDSQIPFHVPLNKWRPLNYLNEFGKCFSILDNHFENPEGEDLLTGSVQRELSSYSKEELINASFIIVGKKI